MAREQLARKRNGTGEYKPVENNMTESINPSWVSHQIKREGGSRYPRYSIEEGTVNNLIKFVQDGYFHWYNRHWVNKVPYTCLGADCPLCGRGVRSQVIYLFNVIDMTNSGDSEHNEPTLKVWEASSDPFNAIKARAEDSKSSPVNREDLYFSVAKRKQDNGTNKFTVDPVKKRDLVDDYEVEPLSDEEFAKLTEELYDKSVVYVAARDDLVKAASELED